MNIDIRKSFFRDLKKITDQTVKSEIEQTILVVKNAQSVKDIPELKKLKGIKKGIFYRIKVGDYRIGIAIEGNLVAFIRCMLRKDIYRFFP